MGLLVLPSVNLAKLELYQEDEDSLSLPGKGANVNIQDGRVVFGDGHGNVSLSLSLCNSLSFFAYVYM